MLHRIPKNEAPAAIAARRPFRTTRTFHAQYLTAATASRTGRLHPTERARWHADWADSDGRMYAVWSYSTPIAWWTHRTGWHIPAEDHTPTTRKHKTRLRLIAPAPDAA
ncbi:hypothetical protein [Nocardia brasiliensis]|uniref:hypothetical protein n=1 Tax=Nocardia brasiliensis TaxID=37326 RepID=UPI003D8E733A